MSSICTNGPEPHLFAPGVDIDGTAPSMLWCNVCGESAPERLTAVEWADRLEAEMEAERPPVWVLAEFERSSTIMDAWRGGRSSAVARLRALGES